MNRSTLLASHIVRKVFAAVPEYPALSTKQIFETALSKFPDEKDPDVPQRIIPNPPRRIRFSYEYVHRKKVLPPPEDPYAEHPLNSVRFLKKYVLVDMAERGEIEKVLVRRGHVGDEDTRQEVNTIKGSLTGRTFEVPRFTNGPTAWMWRLIPDSELNDIKESLQALKRTGSNSQSKSKSKSRR